VVFTILPNGSQSDKNTSSHMMYRELGRLPLQFNKYSRLWRVWYRVSTNNSNKLTNSFYKLRWEFAPGMDIEIGQIVLLYDLAKVRDNQLS
jgi:hypothetical protein